MIFAVLALVSSLAPQEPIAEELRAIHAQIDATARVGAVESRIAELGEGRVAGIQTPAFALALRRAGVDAVDLAAKEVAIGDEEQQVVEAFALARLLMGVEPRSRELNREPDVKFFQRVCEHGYRDLHKALGSGRNLNEVAPWLHSAVEQVRTSVTNLSELDAEQEELLSERMRRLERIEMDVMLAVAEQIVRTAMLLDNEANIEELKAATERGPRADSGVSGQVLIDRDTGFGRMVVGGFGRNSYDVSQIDVLIDPGGDDEYRGPAGGAGELRRMAVVVDLAGNDTYTADNDALGSGTFAVGVLVDMDGDDSYTARNRSAGYGSGGVGVFVDRRGKDTYRLGDQGAALGFGGVGLLLDLAGNDDMEAGVQSFGVGLPGGVGLLLDTSGDDRRVAGSEKKTLAAGAPSDVSIAFGAGVGVMPFLSGGFGALLDLGGQDRYVAKSVACGVGVRGGVGVFHDSWGNDTYQLADVGLGAGYADGIGVFLDDAGDDTYEAAHLTFGSAVDGSIAHFVDRIGDDRYTGVGPTVGQAQRGALGACVDVRGEDAWNLDGGVADWRVSGVEAVELPAVGVFLDTGGAVDRFELVRFAPPLPEDGRTRLLRVGAEGGPDVHVWVDR